MNILAADVGGTKTFLALIACDAQGAMQIAHEQRFVSNDYADFATLLREFLDNSPLPATHACLALAGPVSGQRPQQQASITNLPWQLDAAELAAAFKLQEVIFLNDFEAVGHGVSAIQKHQVECLQAAPIAEDGVRLVIGAGTGLGAAILVPQTEADSAWRVISSESGHAGFAPESPQQVALWVFLQKQFPRVSIEHVLSGAGLLRVYQFVCAQNQTPCMLSDAAAVSQQALLEAGSGRVSAAREALALFVQIYASHTANLALGCLPRGGVYVAGGIAPKILPLLTNGPFLRAFLAKEPMRELLQTLPLFVVLDEYIGLYGALHFGASEFS